MWNARTRQLWMWSFASLWAACGSDDKPSPEPESMMDVEDASMPDGGAGTKMCGNEVCELPKHLVGLEEPCCIDPFSGGCGLMRGGECQRYTKRDGRCPAATPDGKTGEEAELAGVIPCCASNNECGVDVASGLGCMAPSQSCNIFPAQFIEALGSQTCDGEPLELPAGCGNDRE